MAEARVAGQRLQLIEARYRRSRGAVEVEQVQLVALVATLVDLQHRQPAAGNVMRRRDRFGQRGQSDELAGAQLVELHRAGEVAAHKQPLGSGGAVIDVGEHRRVGSQQGA